MRKMRSLVAVFSALSVVACQTAATIGSASTQVSPARSSAVSGAGDRAAASNVTLASRNASAVGIARPVERARASSLAYAEGSDKRTIVIVAVVLLVIVAGALLLSGSGGDGLGY